MKRSNLLLRTTLLLALAITTGSLSHPAEANQTVSFALSTLISQDLKSKLTPEDLRNFCKEKLLRLHEVDQEYIQAHFQSFYSHLTVSVEEDGKNGEDPFTLKDLPLYYGPIFWKSRSFNDLDELEENSISLPPALETLQLLLSLSTEALGEAEKETFLEFRELQGDLLKRVNHSPFITNNGPIHLAFATNAGNYEALRFLSRTVARDKILRAVSSDGVNTLHHALQFGELRQVDWVMSARPELIQQKTSRKVTPLMAAIQSEKEEGALFVLERIQKTPSFMPLMKAIDQSGNSTLDYAAGHGAQRVLQKILEMEPGMIHSLSKLKPKKAQNPLHFAAVQSQSKIVELLLSHAPELAEQIDLSGKLPIIYSIEENDTDSIEIFHRLQPSLFNKRIHNQNTLLHYAALQQQADTIKLLLKLGANPDLLNSQGQRAQDLANRELRKLFPKPATKPAKALPNEASQAQPAQPMPDTSPSEIRQKKSRPQEREVALQIRLAPALAERGPSPAELSPKELIESGDSLTPEQLSTSVLKYWSQLNTDDRARVYLRLYPLLLDAWDKYRFESFQNYTYSLAFNQLLEERSVDVRDVIGTLRLASATLKDHLVAGFILASRDHELEPLRHKLHKILIEMKK
jgi:ankyrin repeat protein